MDHPIPTRTGSRAPFTPSLPIFALWALACPSLPAATPPTASTETATAESTKTVQLEKYTVEGARVYGLINLGKNAQSSREIPQSVSVIGRRQIEQQNLATLDEAMAQMTGVSVGMANTAVIPQFFSRGYQVEYFQFDGVPLQTGGAAWSQPDLAAYEQVEMLRGAAGLFNGAGQPGGVINLVRKRPTRDHAYRLAATAGSWDHYRGEVDVSTPLTASARVRSRIVASYDDQNHWVDWANSQRTSLYGIVEADLSPSANLAAGATYQKRHWLPPMMGVPSAADGSSLGLDRSTFLSTPWSYWDFETTQVFAEFTQTFGPDWQLKLKGTNERETNDLKYSYVSGSVNRATGDGAFLAGGANAYQNDQAGLDAYLTGAVTLLDRRQDLAIGANWYDRDADSASGTLTGFGRQAVNVYAFDPHAYADPGEPVWGATTRTNTRQSGTYGVLRLRLVDDLTLIGGGRLSWWKTSRTNLTTGTVSNVYRADREFSPYGGIVYNVNKTWSAYASYADILRVQSNLLTEDGSSLPPVIGANWETGVKGEWLRGRLTASLATFLINEKNRGQSVSVIPGTVAYYVATGEVESRGVETELSGQVATGWWLSAGYTYNQTEYKKDATYQGQPYRTASPEHLLKLWTNWQLPGANRAWSLGGGVTFQSKTYTTSGTTRVEQDSYAIWHLRLGYRLNPHTEFALNVNNLLDEVYYSRLGSATYGSVYGEPRSFTLSVRFSR